MHVRGEAATKRECVGAGLFLSDAPLLLLARFSLQIRANQFRPLDSRFRFNQTAFLVERNDAIKRTRIDANAVCGKLLAAHRMAASRNGKRQALSRC